jgi:hypothetical protein
MPRLMRALFEKKNIDLGWKVVDGRSQDRQQGLRNLSASMHQNNRNKSLQLVRPKMLKLEHFLPAQSH